MGVPPSHFSEPKKREWTPRSALEFFHFFDLGYLLPTDTEAHTLNLKDSHTHTDGPTMYAPDNNTEFNAEDLPVPGTRLEARLHDGHPDMVARLPANDISNLGRATLRSQPRITRLKMRVNGKSASNNVDNPLTHLSLTAVCSQDAANENSIFGKYTPCGNLSFSVINDVADGFSVGDEIYIDLSLASRA